jgi:hypothetical protein
MLRTALGVGWGELHLGIWLRVALRNPSFPGRSGGGHKYKLALGKYALLTVVFRKLYFHNLKLENYTFSNCPSNSFYVVFAALCPGEGGFGVWGGWIPLHRPPFLLPFASFLGVA